MRYCVTALLTAVTVVVVLCAWRHQHNNQQAEFCRPASLAKEIAEWFSADTSLEKAEQHVREGFNYMFIECWPFAESEVICSE
jgi:hypothetical protein